LTAYDPNHDPDLRILDAASRLACEVVEGVLTQSADVATTASPR
jgi:hypothetical protein